MDLTSLAVALSEDRPRTKEQADYNLKYLIAAAPDDEVGPAQLEQSRVRLPMPRPR
jgi:2-methylcitrate dehydratase